MPEKLPIVLLFGGRSVEHEVSVRSARSVLAALDGERYEPLPVAIDVNGRWFTAENPLGVRDAEAAEGERRPVHLVPEPGAGLQVGEGSGATQVTPGLYFPLVHGVGGEDGTLQGIFEAGGAAYAGAGVLASALAMDKALAKVAFRHARLPILDWRVVTAAEWKSDRQAALNGLDGWRTEPVFVKPSNGGSSIGVTRVPERRDRAAAIDHALQFDRRVVVEPLVPAREVEVSVLGNERLEASMPGEIVPAKDFYDYESKYSDARTQLLVPAPLDPDTASQLRDVALRAFAAIDGAGMGRVDFLVHETTGEIFVSEINTIPGFTEVSMYPRLWEASGVPYPELLDRIIQLGLEAHAGRQRQRRSLR